MASDRVGERVVRGDHVVTDQWPCLIVACANVGAHVNTVGPCPRPPPGTKAVCWRRQCICCCDSSSPRSPPACATGSPGWPPRTPSSPLCPCVRCSYLTPVQSDQWG